MIHALYNILNFFSNLIFDFEKRSGTPKVLNIIAVITFGGY